MRFARPEDRRFDTGKLRLPLVAMVDVVLFLLLYFLVVGTFAGEEGQLPSAVTAERPQGSRATDLQPQIVYVELHEERPAYRVGQHILHTRGQLAEVLAQLPREGGVVVRISTLVNVDHAAAALQACRDAGFRKVSYVPGK
jgi:biopolymer transport protein ExbD